MTEVGYVVPLRWAKPGPISELASYLRGISVLTDETLVVDGSPAPVFAEHRDALHGIARHIRPDQDLHFRMGKVNGVVTGLRECGCTRIVIADDDVRYDRESLLRVVGLLEEGHLVRPQNYFDELPWHARLDTARTLLNRVFTGDIRFPVGDFPGTLAVRREAFLASGAYDADNLFENLELMRTIAAAGGRVLTPLDLYVARKPPTTAHFFSQRVRQAYDDLAVPFRLAVLLAVGPTALALGRRRGSRGRHALALAAAGSIAVAEMGRRRAGGARRFPASSSLLAPLWIAERSLCAWAALWQRARGGVRYGDGRIRRSATPLRRLKRRHRSRPETRSPCGSRRRTGESGSARSDRARPPAV